MIQPSIGYDLPAPSIPPSSSGKKLNFLGWSVLLLGIYSINKTTTGHEMVFYSMVLITLFLFIYNYERIMPAITK